jgi:hypothetical protein
MFPVAQLLAVACPHGPFQSLMHHHHPCVKQPTMEGRGRAGLAIGTVGLCILAVCPRTRWHPGLRWLEGSEPQTTNDKPPSGMGA